jgi:hypothetical protein
MEFQKVHENVHNKNVWKACEKCLVVQREKNYSFGRIEEKN